jgi:ferredoxin-fold anticodon binding domain-containing protein
MKAKSKNEMIEKLKKYLKKEVTVTFKMINSGKVRIEDGILTKVTKKYIYLKSSGKTIIVFLKVMKNIF